MRTHPTKRWLSLSAALMMIVPIIPLVAPIEAHAVADTFTLTKTSSDTIAIAMNGTPQVQMPDGTTITTNASFKVTENMTYTFIGIDGAVKSQKSITMTNVPSATPLLTVAPGEPINLNFKSGDAHSGIKDMRYKMYAESAGETSATWTAWETFTVNKKHNAPSIPTNTSGNWVVKAEFRDVAGNIASNVIGRYFVENVAPTVNISGTTRYTNNRNISVRAEAMTKFENPLEAKIGVSSTALSTVHKLSTFPNLFSGTNTGDERNFVYNLPYLLPDVEKDHTVYMQMTKKQNTQTLSSPIVSTNVMFDKTAPTGTAVINNGESISPSRDVKLTIDTQDNLSGVDKIKIVETGTTKEKWIYNPTAKVVENWTFGMTDKGRITVVIFDKAGNSSTIQSQEVTFAKLNINDIKLTKNRNPQLYSKTPFVEKSTWNPMTEVMLSGSNFEFEVGYDMGVANTVDYTIGGHYIMEIEKDGKTLYKTAQVGFTKKVGDRFESKKVAIPQDMPKDAQVFVTINLNSEMKANTAIKMTETSGKKLFGVIGDKNLDDVINGAIQFNEIN